MIGNKMLMKHCKTVEEKDRIDYDTDLLVKVWWYETQWGYE